MRRHLFLSILLFLFACKKESEPPRWTASVDASPTSATAIFTDVTPEQRNDVYLLASRVAGWFYHTHGVDVRLDFVDNPQDLVLLGVLYAAKEKHDRELTMRAPNAWSCFWTAVGGVIGITDARNIWRSIVEGDMVSSVIGSLKTIAKRTGTIFSVAMMVYGVGDCLDWW